MSFLDGLTPAELAQFDQERADIKNTLSEAVAGVRAYLNQPDVDRDEVWAALVHQCARIDRVRLLSLFSEAVLRLSALEEEVR